MRCRKARWFLSARCDGTLSARQRARLDDHLAHCPACRREGFYFSEIAALAGRMEKVSVRPDFNLRLRAAIRRTESGALQPAAGRWRFRPAFGHPVLVTVAASVVAVCGIAGYWFWPTDRPTTVTGTSAAVTVSTAQVQPVALTPLDPASPEMARFRQQYLAGSTPESYILEATRLDDPMLPQSSPRYVLPTVSTEQVARKDSF